GHIATWTVAAERLKGYTADEIIGRHFSIFYGQADRAARKPDWELEVAARDGRIEIEGWRLRKDGSQFWANVVITALRDESGELVGFAKVTRDMTKRREAEQRLQESERAKADFLNLAAHELRSPLTIITGYLSLIEDGTFGQIGPGLQRAIAPLRAKADEMNRLISHMLEAARIDQGSIVLRRDVRDLRDVARQAVMTANLSPGRTMPIGFEPGDCDVRVSIDSDRVQLVLDNLLSNAVKYSPDGGPILCRVRTIDHQALVDVIDHGVGIAPEDQPTLFRRFARITGKGHDNIPGTGLGLYLSREMALLHGGDIHFHSTPGKGSTFSLALPLAN
ncbi:MAG TPA: HAMP domain-containing sensor histidine kinase, partial [Candidatus Limnocylindrales bacterium]|nr:HAMP domain-containing sensor histidine kinase [Candidatus Limnocylindrales bacterium]